MVDPEAKTRGNAGANDSTAQGVDRLASSEGLTGVLHAIGETGAGDRVRVDELVAALGSRSLAPLLLLPCIVLVSPVSGIVGVSTVCGLSIVLIAVHIMAGRRTLSLPAFAGRWSIDRGTLSKALRWAGTPARHVDGLFRRRLTALTRTRLGHLPGTVTVMVGLCVPLMEVVPFSATPTGATLSMMALGLLTDDGLFVLIGMIFAIVAAVLAVSAVSAIFL